MGDTTLLEARLADLADALERLESRVAALEQAGPQRRSAAQAALNRSAAAPPRDGERAIDGAQATRILSLGGRTLLVLAGAFILRAVTEAGTVPAWAGVGLGFAYAGVWMLMADRAGHAGQTLSAAFHAVSVVIIGFPLLFEAATRFHLFPPAGAAAVLTALTGAALLLATRRSLPSLAWVVTLGGMATAVSLMQKSGGQLVPGALYLVLLGIATLWIGYVRDWTGLRWPSAMVADLVVLLVAVPAAGGGTAGTLLVQSTLVALYLGSFATRTLYMGRRVVPFEMVQTGAVIAVGIGGAVWVAVRSGMGQAGFGVASAVFGAASYAVAFAFVQRRQKLKENFYFYTSVAIVLLLAGTGLLLSGASLAVAWALLAALFGWLALRQQSRTLATHGAIYGVGATLAGGLLPGAGAALLVGSAVTWRPGPASVAVLLLVAASAWLASGAARRTVVERIPPLTVYLVLTVGVTGLVVALLAAPVAGTGTGASPGALATLRTVALVVAAVAAAALGRAERLSEWSWLPYPVLAITGLKMLLEDLPRGRPATLILAFAFYGGALILVPKIRTRKPAAAPGADGPGAGDGPAAG
jgi:hypothetical protein